MPEQGMSIKKEGRKEGRKEVAVIGAGLAGCEAAWQLAKRGVAVRLFDMKPLRFSPAHINPNFCELVCSNSLKSNAIDNACGLLKQELRMMDSIVIACADKTTVPAGGALAVDRDAFAQMVTDELKNNEDIEIVSQEVSQLDVNIPTIVAVGPLAQGEIAACINEICEGELYFYDAAAPIVATASIDMDNAYYAARYDKGGADYINCPMDKSQYFEFYNQLISAQTAPLHCFEDLKVFEGCMPIEVLAKRGERTLLFGPLKPKGLLNPKTGREDYAVVQLRQDNFSADMYSMVGFQTNLKWGEQSRVFSMIPALKNAEFLRYGVMHRNTYINSPRYLTANYQHKTHQNLFFAGQITGVEGYVECVSSGMISAIAMYKYLSGEQIVQPIMPSCTCSGALSAYIASASEKNFQPMNANFGIIEPLPQKIRDKKERYREIVQRALKSLDQARSR